MTTWNTRPSLPATTDREAATSGGERSGDEGRGGRKRRRRRRGGRRSKHDQAAGQATPHEGDEVTAEEPVRAHLESGDESDAAAGAPAEERERKGRPKRRRRRGSGRGREQKHAAEQAAEAEPNSAADDVASGDSLGEPHDDFANVMADDEAGDDDAGGDEIGDDDGGDSQLDKNSHRAIPAWEEAIGFIISINMESRAKNPKTSSPRGRGRGRGNRGGGRGNSHRRAN